VDNVGGPLDNSSDSWLALVVYCTLPAREPTRQSVRVLRCTYRRASPLNGTRYGVALAATSNLRG